MNLDLVDDVVEREKYIDEKWIISLDWADVLLPGQSLAGAVTCNPVGVELLSVVQQTGTITTVMVGGGTGIPGNSDRLQYLAPINDTEALGWNIGVPTRSR
jgi:hypothetical protein